MVKKLTLGWQCYETIGVAIINPRAASKFIDPFALIGANIRDFCYEHSSKKQMRIFVKDMLVKHPGFADRIKDEILKICPQYRELIEKLLPLV